MDETFDALFELDKSTVVSDREDTAADLGTNWVALGGVKPGIRRQLLEAEGDALLILIKLEHLDLNLVADIDEIAGMGEPAPAHVGDVEQAIESAEIDEGTVVREVLDGSGEDGSFLKGGEGNRLLGVLLLFEQFLAGDDDVTALFVQLDNADFNLGTDVAVQIADGADLDLRAGEEGLDADVDGETALDAGDDHALDGGLGVGCLFELVPDLVTQSLLVGDGVASAVLLFTLNNDFDGVTGGELRCAVGIHHLIERQQALTLQTNVDHRVLVGNLDDGPGDNNLFLSEILGDRGLCGLLAIEVCECGGEVGVVVILLGLFGGGGERRRDLPGGRILGRRGLAGRSRSGRGGGGLDRGVEVNGG